MTDSEARIRIDFGSGEVEIEGTEEFVERHLELIEELEGRARRRSNTGRTTLDDEDREDSSSPGHMGDGLPKMPDYFGEWFHLFTHRDLAQVDKALIAGYYIQCYADEGDFTTGEVNETLDEVDVSLSNTSQSIKNLVSSKKAYKTNKESGKQHYKVSREGFKYLETILEEDE